ncbi:MAG: hypothetical protein PHY47_06445 [Lachnospiraceae bacterium]|nr:hypothetical protein [Lachnospiraceae bacterium]
MARKEEEQTPVEAPKITKEDKKKIQEEKKRLKAEMKALKKESKEAAALEDDDEKGGVLSIVFVTAFIVLIWLAILGLLIKLDVGGFASAVLRPVLKDVPVINKILPAAKGEEGEADLYYGYDSMEEAVQRIKELELELQEVQTTKNEDTSVVDDLKAEIKRLKTFEDNQVEFEKIKNEFYNEVVYAENAPDVENYKKYYEEIDPTNAEILYKQVVEQVEYNKEIEDYAKAYSSMKPKQAAGILEAMTDDLDLASKILLQMSSDQRGSILGVMDPEVAAKLTKIMDPEK